MTSFALAIENELDREAEQITIRGHYFTDAGVKYLAKHLPKDCPCKVLSLDDCSLGAKGGAALGSQVLPKVRALQGLFLSSNDLTDHGLKHLAGHLNTVGRLRTIRIDSNSIGDPGAVALFRALPGTDITTVGVSNNHIADGGAKALARSLPGCKFLATVNLNRNRITNGGARHIALAIPHSASNDTIDLGLNLITEKGERALRIAREKQSRERKIRATFDKLDGERDTPVARVMQMT
jgi:Ran GTPase-activating protein (RanGAP) involved in mRNA processing and transport